jgi:hypothetical protein
VLNGRASRPTRAMANVLTGVFVLLVVASVAVAFVGAQRAGIRAGHAGWQQDVLDANEMLRRALMAEFIGFVLAIVIFPIWSWKLFNNARLMARGSAPAPGWAIFAWLIPFVNYVLPGVHLARVDRISGRSGTGAVPLIVAWNLLFALATVLYAVNRNTVLSPGTWWLVWLSFAATAVCGALMVRSMTARQEHGLTDRYLAQLATSSARESGVPASAAGARYVPLLRPTSAQPVGSPTSTPTPTAMSTPAPAASLAESSGPTYGRTRRAPLAELPPDEPSFSPTG